MERLETTPTKYKNTDCETNINYVVKISRTLLTPIGIYPLHGSGTALSNFLVTIQIIIIFSLMLFLLVPHLIYTYWDAEDLTKLMKIIAAQVFNSLALIKFWTMIINKDSLRWCLAEIQDSWRNVSCDEDKQIPLPYPCDYVFFVPQDSPGYEMLFVTQIIISSLILSTNCGIYSLIATYIVHACCLFEIVGRHLDEVGKTVEGEVLQKLTQVIDKHTFAMKYALTLEKSLNIVFLSEMVGCTIIICFLEYGILLDFGEKNYLGMVTYVVLMTSILVNVFILSFIGDRLKEQSSKISEYTYDLEWHSMPKHMVHNLLFIMIRSNQPVTLTAGKLFDVSLQGFADVVKTSAAYLNFLRAVV
ncbi:odorant receptor 13a-like isoform X2 [Fopius arisanus]|uniref:Odorant receptor n=1 Tax=Fopius arisanus TaxID=64838 RepID=A0A9R1U4C4_9HYME|nr:PREDICTED: odorant receptor 13a-like isoform X2 [Fopius arisanus]